MGIFLSLLQMVVPFLILFLVIAVILKWCGKAATVSEGFGKVLSWIGSVYRSLNDDTVPTTQVFPYYIDRFGLKGFNAVGSTYFSSFIFSDIGDGNGCETVCYITRNPKYDSDIEDMISCEFRNYLQTTQNLHINVTIEIWVSYVNNMLLINFALNAKGIEWINQQRLNSVSRQVNFNSELDLLE